MFRDRVDAGRHLAQALLPYRTASPLVLGLPRGGVPVAVEVARALAAPWDVLVVRKLGAPFNPEFAIGAVGEGDVVVLHPEAVSASGVSDATVQHMIAEQRQEIAERVRRFRGGRAMPEVAQRTVIVVDDGAATGATASAAVAVLRSLGAGRIVVALPVGARDTVARLRTEADDVICLEEPEWFHAVGQFYEDFTPTTDADVLALIDKRSGLAGAAVASAIADEVSIPVASGLALPGHVTVPAGAIGIVAFAHGSGSSRHSPRNQWVARVLNDVGIGTLLFDLLTEDEAADRRNVFDIPFLAARLTAAKRWLTSDPRTSTLPIAYFGASTGAAAALVAAAQDPRGVRAVVSRGGRPDLAGDWLPRVLCPTLLIVGGEDRQVLDLNRLAQEQLTCHNDLVVVPGATHLFEEPGTLQRAADLAAAWFAEHLTTVESGVAACA